MICTPIKEKTVKALLANLKKSQKKADLVEIWFDEIKDLSEEKLKKIFSVKKIPFIYKTTRQKNPEKILKFNIEYLDLDMSAEKSLIKRIKRNFPKTKLILSFHDFKQTPDKKKLKNLGQTMLKKGADIVKIAAYAKHFSDTLNMLELLDSLSQKRIPCICISMGENGKLTRICGHLLGNYLMFAPLALSKKTADGQIEISKLRKIMRAHGASL